MSKLYFRYGAMNSGKSTNLMQVAHNYEERGMKVVLIKPQTFMNLSGQSVRPWIDFYDVDLEDILVIYDDLDINKERDYLYNFKKIIESIINNKSKENKYISM